MGFGAAGLSNLNASGVGPSFELGHAWDADIALIKIISQFDLVGSAWFLSGGLGLDYFFTQTEISPYVTADFGAGAAKIDGGGAFDGQTVGGFVLGGGAGVQFLRTASVNLDLGFRAGFLLHANTIGTPQSYVVRLGMFF